MNASVKMGLFALVLSLLAMAESRAQSWRQFVSQAGSYEIQVPSPPSFQTKALQIKPSVSIDMHLAIAIIDNVAFVAAHADYPSKALDRKAADILLEGIVEGAAEGNKLEWRRGISIAGHQGREFLISTANGAVLLIRATVVANRIFQIAVVGPAGIERNPAAQRFLDSFRPLAR